MSNKLKNLIAKLFEKKRILRGQCDQYKLKLREMQDEVEKSKSALEFSNLELHRIKSDLLFHKEAQNGTNSIIANKDRLLDEFTTDRNKLTAISKNLQKQVSSLLQELSASQFETAEFKELFESAAAELDILILTAKKKGLSGDEIFGVAVSSENPEKPKLKRYKVEHIDEWSKEAIRDPEIFKAATMRGAKRQAAKAWGIARDTPEIIATEVAEGCT